MEKEIRQIYRLADTNHSVILIAVRQETLDRTIGYVKNAILCFLLPLEIGKNVLCFQVHNF